MMPERPLHIDEHMKGAVARALREVDAPPPAKSNDWIMYRTLGLLIGMLLADEGPGAPSLRAILVGEFIDKAVRLGAGQREHLAMYARIAACSAVREFVTTQTIHQMHPQASSFQEGPARPSGAPGS